MTATGATKLVDALVEAGVEVVFGLPGVHNLAAWAALRDRGVRIVTVRHEQTAVYAADGYARATGQVGVALVTSGPGAANALGATGEAWASRSPVVVLATDVATTVRRPGGVRGALHEAADQRAMFAPVCKETVRCERVASLRADVLGALRAALAAPSRPVMVELPTDVLDAAVAVGQPPSAPPVPVRSPADTAALAAGGPSASVSAASPAPPPAPAPRDLDAALALLRTARRPLVWAGGGARDASAEVAALAAALGAPILTTYAARGVAGSSPLTVGLPPHVPAAGALWDDADLVLAVGSDLDGMSTQGWRQPQPPALLAVNVDAGDAAKSYPPDVVVAADAACACAALTAALAPEPRSPWADLDAIRATARAQLDPEGRAFLDAFALAVPPDALLLLDMCLPGYWLAGFHHPPRPRLVQYPMGWGTLGFAFPAAIGAAVAGTGSPVVSVSGDGGFLFAPGELATVAQDRLPLTAVIVDDGGYGMLRVSPRYDEPLATPDFAALAGAFGVATETVDGLGDAFGAALARHVAGPEPSVLVARAPSLPAAPTTSPRWYRAAEPQP